MPRAISSLQNEPTAREASPHAANQPKHMTHRKKPGVFPLHATRNLQSHQQLANMHLQTRNLEDASSDLCNLLATHICPAPPPASDSHAQPPMPRTASNLQNEPTARVASRHPANQPKRVTHRNNPAVFPPHAPHNPQRDQQLANMHLQTKEFEDASPPAPTAAQDHPAKWRTQRAAPAFIPSWMNSANAPAGGHHLPRLPRLLTSSTSFSPAPPLTSFPPAPSPLQ